MTEEPKPIREVITDFSLTGKKTTVIVDGKIESVSITSYGDGYYPEEKPKYVSVTYVPRSPFKPQSG